MRMMFATPCEDYKVNDVLVRALDRIFILHADHEQNASTSTVRLCGSSGTNPFAAIAAGVACLWGPAHGGANEAALNMLYDIQAQGGVAKIGEFITQVKDKNSSVQADGLRPSRLQELRPARQADARDLPRGARTSSACTTTRCSSSRWRSRRSRSRTTTSSPRKLYPNVDFYSGIVQSAIGIPVQLFTAIFALARTVGWIAQLNEMIADPEYKIGRPRQLYVGRRAAHGQADRRALNRRVARDACNEKAAR